MDTPAEKGTEKGDKGELQRAQLVDILSRFKHYFTPIFTIALKKADGKALSDNEKSTLKNTPDSEDLVLRIKGLIRRFGDHFNSALESIEEAYRITISTQTEKKESVFENTDVEKQDVKADIQRRKVPKGYSLWDLKQLKLHESTPDKRIWVAFWSLRGESGVGEFTYNPQKQLIYFKPYDPDECSAFPVVIDNLRNASVKAKALYYRVTEDPSKL